MMPEGWIRTTIAGVSSVPVSYGVVQTGDPVEGGVPCVRVVDIASRDLKRDSMITTSHEISAAYSRTVLKEGDLMIALRGIIGQTAQATSELEGCNLTRGIARISPKKGAVTSDFLLQSLNGPEFKNLINRQANGSALQEISIATLRKAPVLLPPISEQQRIAETLKTWDRAIETVEVLIANARAQKQALMQQLLPQGSTPPKKRLPGFSGEWREAKLGSLADISKGEQKGRASLAEEGPVPVINGGITPSGYTDHPNTAANTITISEGGNSCGYVDLITQPFWCGGHCYALKNLKVERDYLFAVLKHRERQIMSLRVGSGLPNIQKKAMSQFSIPVPPKSEQVKIGGLAASADKEIAGHETQLTALCQEKAALMQQLLTGKRRVKLPESEVTHA